MQLDSLKAKVMFHNSIDVWIAACQERELAWSDTSEYRRFIAYLLQNKINLKSFNLCSHEAGATEEEKTRFAEKLAENKDDPNSQTYTVKLADSTIDMIRAFWSSS